MAAGKVTAIEWVASVVETFGFQHSEIMRMPFVTFMAYQRLASTRETNAKLRKQFG